MKKMMVGVVGAGVVVIGGCYLLTQSTDEARQMEAEKAAMEEKTMMEKEKLEMEKKAMAEQAMVEKAGEMVKDDEAMMKKTEETMKKDETMMEKKEEAMIKDEAAAMVKAGSYTAYDANKLAMAATGDVVLFFKASWCPSCRTVDADIKANASVIPSTLTIMEVDYDASTAFKQKYGVTTQHTFVQVDSNGALLKKWSGGSTLASVVAQVQ